MEADPDVFGSPKFLPHLALVLIYFTGFSLTSGRHGLDYLRRFWKQDLVRWTIKRGREVAF